MTFWIEQSYPMKDRGIHEAFYSSLFDLFITDNFDRFEKSHPFINIQGETFEYEVESILDTKKERGKQHYQVKWKGYISYENARQARSLFRNSQKLLQEFESSQRCSPRGKKVDD